MANAGRMICFVGAVLLASMAPGDWWSNGQLVTHTRIGYQGNDISAYQVDPLTNDFGINASYSIFNGPFFVGDDFTPTSSAIVRHVRLRWFQPQNPSPAVTAVHLLIYRGSPLGTPNLIYSASRPEMVTSNGAYLSPFTGNLVFRTSGWSGAAALNSSRRIQEVTVQLDGGVALDAGQQYTFAWSIETPGIEAPCPTLYRRGNGIAGRLVNGNYSWEPALGTETNQNSGVDFSFDLFLAETAAESVVPPSSVILLTGTHFGGSLEDLAESDDERMTWLDGQNQVCHVRFQGMSPILALQKVDFDIELSALKAGLSAEIMLYNFGTNRWTRFGFVAPTQETLLHTEVIPFASDYVGPNRQLIAEVRWQPVNDDAPNQDGWLHSIDTCYWRVTPE